MPDQRSIYIDGTTLPWRDSPYRGVQWKKLHFDPESGDLAAWQCDQSVREVFIEGTEPIAICSLHGGQQRESWVRRLRNWFRRD